MSLLSNLTRPFRWLHNYLLLQLLVATLATFLIGSKLWGIQAFRPLLSSVRAATPTETVTPTVTQPAKPKTFDETVTLQFFVEKDYAVTVKGVIELQNNTGKDISLTQYSMDLPYFTLKKTQIGYVYPEAFLVDMYSENNSILFTFKSMFTKPVVIGKNGKITFTFTAQVSQPFKDLGPLRTLAFPFTLSDDHRKTNITIVMDQSLPVVAAPKTSSELAQKGIYTITETSGKGFVFLVNKLPLAISLSSTQEVTLPLPTQPTTCMKQLPVSCTACKEIRSQENSHVTALKANSSTKIASSFAKTFDAACLAEQVKNSDLIAGLTAQSRQKIAGYAIIPDTQTLIPATWEYITTAKGTYVQLLDTNNVIYPFGSDFFGTLLLPLMTCKTDDECIKATQTLRVYNASIIDNQTTPDVGYVEAKAEDIHLAITQNGTGFNLIVENTTDRFLVLTDPRLADNTIFELNDSISHIIPPKSTTTYTLFTKKKIQTSNQQTTLIFKTKNLETSVQFLPVRITMLAFIEFLGYLFVVALGVCILSILGIILYNRFYGKSKI